MKSKISRFGLSIQQATFPTKVPLLFQTDISLGVLFAFHLVQYVQPIAALDFQL